jgi:pimeloyl-ACP methyl ester carboxylesterase
LHDEVALLEPVFARAGERFALVGHSYGAAVALLAALKWPERIHALVLYEPTLFALIDAASPAPNAADGIRETVTRAAAALAAGDRGAAAEAFIDYWMGAGAWAAKPESQRGAIESAVLNVQGWGRALLGESTPLAAFRALQMPVLLMQGSETPASARAVAALLARTLPRVETLSFEGLGHMGPITHPALVDAAIDDFLGRHPAP